MAVEVSSGDAFEAGAPAVLVEGDFALLASRQYDVSQDGQHFYVIAEFEQDDAQRPQIVVVQNWLSELERLVPTN